MVAFYFLFGFFDKQIKYRPWTFFSEYFEYFAHKRPRFAPINKVPTSLEKWVCKMCLAAFFNFVDSLICQNEWYKIFKIQNVEWFNHIFLAFCNIWESNIQLHKPDVGLQILSAKQLGGYCVRCVCAIQSSSISCLLFELLKINFDAHLYIFDEKYHFMSFLVLDEHNVTWLHFYGA